MVYFLRWFFNSYSGMQNTHRFDNFFDSFGFECLQQALEASILHFFRPSPPAVYYGSGGGGKEYGPPRPQACIFILCIFILSILMPSVAQDTHLHTYILWYI